MHSYWGIPVILAVMALTLVLWCRIRSGVLILVMIVVIPSSGWRVCLGIFCLSIMSIVLLILLTFPHDDKQLGDAHTGVIPLVHYH